MADEKTTIEEIKLQFSDLKDTLLGLFKKDLKFGSATTKDGKKLTYDGTELKEGITAKFGDEAVPDGDYVLDNGDTLKIEGGLVKEFKKFEQEPVNQGYTKEELDAKFSALEKSNTESMDKLATAITALLGNNAKTLEAVEKFAAQTKEPAIKRTGMTGSPDTIGDAKAAERAEALKKMQGLTQN